MKFHPYYWSPAKVIELFKLVALILLLLIAIGNTVSERQNLIEMRNLAGMVAYDACQDRENVCSNIYQNISKNTEEITAKSINNRINKSGH